MKSIHVKGYHNRTDSKDGCPRGHGVRGGIGYLQVNLKSGKESKQSKQK